MTDPSTRPVQISGGGGEAGDSMWQTEGTSWDSGQSDRIVVGWPGIAPSPVDLPDMHNTSSGRTVRPQAVSDRVQVPFVVSAPKLGRRSLEPLSHWECVVEQVHSDRFRARVAQINDGSEVDTPVAYTEFLFDDLANVEDRELVQPGAIFYWTIARQSNAAGTVSNVSLVRFRRLPAPTRAQRERAEREADDLYQALGGGIGPESSGG